MSRITTHVLDTSRGLPGAGIRVRLERLTDSVTPTPVAKGITDADGRAAPLTEELPPGRYRLVFGTGEWFAAQGLATLYPEVVVHFEVLRGERHYHIPLLLSPFGYSTYRGS